MGETDGEIQRANTNSAPYWPTWHTSNAHHMGVASVEAVKQVGRLTGVQHHNLGGGVSAGAHPNPTGHLILKHQLLLLFPLFLILTNNPKIYHQSQ